MKLRVLVTSPASSKLLADLTASGLFVRTQHPELTLDVLVDPAAVPEWWSPPGEWFTLRHSIPECSGEYALAIQTTPSEDLARDLLAVIAENRAGIVLQPSLHIQGRWAQTLVAQLGCQRFAPFTPFDLFNHVLLGRTSMDFSQLERPLTGQWIVDLDSFPNEQRPWAEDVLSQLSLTHPGKVRDGLWKAMNPREVAAYIGSNSAAASWLAYQGAQVALFSSSEPLPMEAPAAAHAWLLSLHHLPAVAQLVALLASKDNRAGFARQYTVEYLGGQLLLAPGKLDDAALVFDRLHYVVFNYLNDLIEVDLPIPEVSAQCCLRLKGAQAVFGKLVHLNQFGIKFLQEFLTKVDSGTVTDADINEITQKMSEIDGHTEKTLSVYPELDILRMWIQFAKAGAAGENVIEIAKSMILILHEANQAMQAYGELIEAVVKKHGHKQESTGP